MPLPHIQNSTAGRNKFDPVHNNIFEVRFTLPDALKDEFGADEYLLTEHLLHIDGLDALGRHPTTSTQKFMGTDRSYVQSKLDNTRAEFTTEFTLNLRDDTDNYIYKLFRAWARLGYDINTGSRSLKREYCADWMAIDVANRAGDIYWQIIFKDVMLNSDIGGLNELNYDSGEAITLTAGFVSDWWQETQA